MKKTLVPRINTVVIAGRLTREPEIRYTNNNMMIAKMGFAFDRAKKDEYGNYQSVAHFIDVSCFGKTAEAVQENCHKGSPVLIEGSINTNTYTDQTGVQKKTVEIFAERVMLLEKEYEDNGQSSYHSHPHSSNSPQNPSNGKPQNSEEDVPF